MKLRIVKLARACYLVTLSRNGGEFLLHHVNNGFVPIRDARAVDSYIITSYIRALFLFTLCKRTLQKEEATKGKSVLFFDFVDNSSKYKVLKEVEIGS